MSENTSIRNIAIIAHVDHGKTTLVDQMFRQSGLFRANQEITDRVMDSMELEKERGITIAAKNCSVEYEGIKINIIDTPGHADFGGEVERALFMVDGAILLVDAAEGVLPQTRFVLEKALKEKLAVVVAINKIDRKDARPTAVLNELYDLFIDLDATEEQIDFPVLFTVGRDGIAQCKLEDEGSDLKPLFEAIITRMPPPRFDENEPFQMLVCNLGYSDYTGRLAIGRVMNGRAEKNNQLVCLQKNDRMTPLKVSKLQVYKGLHYEEVDAVGPGEIVVLSGVEDVTIGDTICNMEQPKAYKRIEVDEPTVAMSFMVNTSPLFGQEGKYVQSARIYERLQKETLYNVAIEVERTEGDDVFIVKGRGELQLAILIETMRREGFELAVGQPRILFKEDNGKTLEPIERVVIDVDNDYTGIVSEKMGQRKGIMIHMDAMRDNKRSRLEFKIPSRGLIGYRSEFMTDTKGTGILNSFIDGYEEMKSKIELRKTGSLISDRAGKAVAYGLWSLEDRGRLFIEPGAKLYEGMIIGEHNRDNDLTVNPSRTKKLTNVRTSSTDEAVNLTPIQLLSLEQAIEFINNDELVEVTPQSIRMRKTILSATERKIQKKKNQS